jgi:hypothetical protein
VTILQANFVRILAPNVQYAYSLVCGGLKAFVMDVTLAISGGPRLMGDRYGKSLNNAEDSRSLPAGMGFQAVLDTEDASAGPQGPEAVLCGVQFQREYKSAKEATSTIVSGRVSRPLE